MLAAQLLLTLRLNLRENDRYHMNAMNIEKRQYIRHWIPIRKYDIVPQQVSPSSHAASGGSEVAVCRKASMSPSHFVRISGLMFETTQ
jgi:hypothetical protein